MDCQCEMPNITLLPDHRFEEKQSRQSLDMFDKPCQLLLNHFIDFYSSPHLSLPHCFCIYPSQTQPQPVLQHPQTSLGEIKNGADQLLSSFHAEVCQHHISIYLKSKYGHCPSSNLFFLCVQQMNLIPQVQDLCLVCQGGLAIWFVPVDILSSSNWEGIVNITFQHAYTMPEDQDPDYKWHKRLPDDLGHMPTKVIAPVSLVTNGYNLKYLI